MKSTLLSISLIFAALAAPQAMALDASYYASESKLARGHWVKVEIDTTGIFELTPRQLAEWGFDDSANVAVYGYGGATAQCQTFGGSPDDLTPVPVIRTSDKRVLFYGEGPVRFCFEGNATSTITVKRNYYDSKAYYFVTEGPSAAPPVLPYTDASAPLRWHYCISAIENELENHGQGGVFYFDRQLKAGDRRDLNYAVRDFYKAADSSAPLGYFRYNGYVYSRPQVKFPISAGENVVVTTNKPEFSEAIPGTGEYLHKAICGYATFEPAESASDSFDAVFSVSVPDDFPGSYAALDKAYIIYPQSMSLKGRSELPINLSKANSAGCNIEISDAAPSTEVWNVSDITAISRYEVVAGSEETSVAVALGAASVAAPPRLIAFNPEARHHSVKFAGVVHNQNLHGMATPDMLIVTNGLCEGVAGELAQIHRDMQGLDVAVVRQEAIFNEFSSGARNAGAIRRLAKMFYDRDPEKFRFIILYGASTYDNLNILNVAPEDFLVSFQVEEMTLAHTGTTNSCVDQFFGMLDDGFKGGTDYISTKARMLVSVGRIPAANPALGRDANQKIRERLQNPVSARIFLRTLLSSDMGDSNGHFLQADAAAGKILEKRPEASVIRADLELYPANTSVPRDHEAATLLDQWLQSGVGLFDYSGHGDTDNVSSGKFYNRSRIRHKKYGVYPFAILSSCFSFSFDRVPYNIAEVMLFTPGGGAIGVIGTSRSVYLEHNKNFNNYLSAAYASADASLCTGDVLRIARNTMIDDGKMLSGVGRNTLNYNLCGDPAIPLGAPVYDILISQLGNRTADNAEPVPAKTGLRLKATITDSGNNKVADFNGFATVDVFDVPYELTNLNNSKWTATCDFDILATVTVPVVNGEIDATVVLPSSDKEGSHRMLITAADPGRRGQAAGQMTDITITPADDYAAGIDTSAPVIEEFYINTPDFVSGSTVAPDFTVEATIDPSATGLRFGTTGIATGSRVIFDGHYPLRQVLNSMAPDADGKIRLSFNLADVADGNHSITIEARNNAGEYSTATVDFCVARIFSGSLSAEPDFKVARRSISFDFDPAGRTVTSSKLYITDREGNTVFTGEPPAFPLEHDVTGLADGCYSAYVLFETAEGYGRTNVVDFVVVK